MRERVVGRLVPRYTVVLLVAVLVQVVEGFVLGPPSAAAAAAATSASSTTSTTSKLWSQWDTTEPEAPKDNGLVFHVVDRRSAIVGAASTLLVAAAAVTATPWSAEAKEPTTNSANAKIPEWTLEGNVLMPKLALNTVGLSAEETERAVRYAVKHYAAGTSKMVHVDFHPGQERDGVAAYIAKEEGGRQGLFLNTKIRKAPPGTTPEAAAETTRKQIDEDLKVLGVGSTDMLMLRDSPDCAVIQAQWAVLEEALAAGKTRSLGVINFCESALTCVLATAKVKPALNYFMLHVGMGPDAHGLRSFGESRGIRTFAYGAVGEPGPNPDLLKSPILQRMGAAHTKSTEQVALRWVLQSGAGVSVRPTIKFGLGTGFCGDIVNNNNECDDGIQARASSYNWSLTAKEMTELDAMTSPDDNPTLFSSTGCPNSFVMSK